MAVVSAATLFAVATTLVVKFFWRKSELGATRVLFFLGPNERKGYLFPRPRLSVSDVELRRVVSPAFLAGCLACAALGAFFLAYSLVRAPRWWVGAPVSWLGAVLFGLGVVQETAEDLVEACRNDVLDVLAKQGAVTFQRLLDELPWSPDVLRAVVSEMVDAREVRHSKRDDRLTLAPPEGNP
ncbi:MAG: hypothetical protein Kow0069_14940 [Promethearchaeota archaeon]